MMDLFLTLSADRHNERHRERRHFFCKFALVRDLDAARLAHSPVAIRNHAHNQSSSERLPIFHSTLLGKLSSGEIPYHRNVAEDV